MTDTCLLREEKNGVCYLTLNRPEKLNALDTVLFRAIDEALADLEGREDLLLRGSRRGCLRTRGTG